MRYRRASLAVQGGRLAVFRGYVDRVRGRGKRRGDRHGDVLEVRCRSRRNRACDRVRRASGRGIGRKLMERLIDELGPRVTFLLDAGRSAAVRSWVSTCAARWASIRERGAAGRRGPARRRAAARGTPADWPRLIELDARASGLQRDELMSALFQRGESVVLERDGEVVGFSVLRRFGRGDVIGPAAPRKRRCVCEGARQSLADATEASSSASTCRTGPVCRTGWPNRVWRGSIRVRRWCATRPPRHEGPADPACGQYALVSQAML